MDEHRYDSAHDSKIAFLFGAYSILQKGARSKDEYFDCEGLTGVLKSLFRALFCLFI